VKVAAAVRSSVVQFTARSRPGHRARHIRGRPQGVAVPRVRRRASPPFGLAWTGNSQQAWPDDPPRSATCLLRRTATTTLAVTLFPSRVRRARGSAGVNSDTNKQRPPSLARVPCGDQPQRFRMASVLVSVCWVDPESPFGLLGKSERVQAGARTNAPSPGIVGNRSLFVPLK